MTTRPRPVPALDPGITLIRAPPRSTAVHRVALAALRDRDGTAVWIDACDTASTRVLTDLATRRTLDRLRVARAWTAYQHHELVRRLPDAVDARTALVVAPAVTVLYGDDDIPHPEDRHYLEATLAVLDEVCATLDLAALVSMPADGAFASLVTDHASQEIRVAETRLGYRFEAEGFETTVYWGEGHWQTTIPYWVELLGAIGDRPAVAAYDAGLVDAEV